MSWHLGKNSEGHYIIRCEKYESQCKMDIYVGERNANGIPVTLDVHYKMDPNGSSFFGYCVGYQVAYSRAGGNWHYLASVYGAEYQGAGTGYGAGDPDGLMKRYGAGRNPGGFYGDYGTYWRPRHGWLPYDSGPLAGTSRVFSGTVPMAQDQAEVYLYYQTWRPWNVTDQYSVEDLTWFDTGWQSFKLEVGPYTIIPLPAKNIEVSPTEIPLEDANKTKINLSFERGQDAVKTNVYLRTDINNRKEYDNKLLFTTNDSKFTGQIDVKSSIGVDKILDNIDKHIWFEFESISKTGHNNRQSSSIRKGQPNPTSKQIHYYERVTLPPKEIQYFSAAKVSEDKDENIFFNGQDVKVKLSPITYGITNSSGKAQEKGIGQGTFEIVKMELIVGTIHKLQFPQANSTSVQTIYIPHLGFDGWNRTTGKKPITITLKATDEAGRSVYGLPRVGYNSPSRNVFAVGGIVYIKQSSGSWRMGLAYQKRKGEWKPARRIYKKHSGRWFE